MTISRIVRRVSAATLVIAASTASGASSGQGSSSSLTFMTNPITIRMPGGGRQTNCADPTVLRGQGTDPYWYAVCTTDSLSDDDVDASGNRRMHYMPMIRSRDLVTWDYVGDAFTTPPAWAVSSAGLWAPELTYRNGQYLLYYVVTDVADAVSGEPGCGSDNAIGVATSTSPTGPWTDSGSPVVFPRRAGGGCNFFWTYDPDVLTTSSGKSYLYYGSYYGGIEARELTADGLDTLEETATPITIANRYEGANVIERDGSFWLFASASNCCNGPLTGYQVFAGRASSPLGPFVDREGVSLRATRVGGSPVLTTNGNRWVGTGHNAVFRDARGDWFTAYHAIDTGDPYFEGDVGYTRRPLAIDRLTWDDGWPEVRHGLGASATSQLAPVAQPCGSRCDHTLRAYVDSYLSATDPQAFLRWLDGVTTSSLTPVPSASDEFDGATLDPKWTWVRPPADGTTAIEGGALRFATQAAELFGGTNDASVLTTPAPAGNYLVEAKLDLDLPDEGCCFNYVQSGLVAYGSDDAYLKLTHVSIWETRQIEFAKEIPSPAPGFPAYGSGVGGPPARTTWLRIAKVTRGGVDYYVSASSRDGVRFARGPVWTHSLGAAPKIGLVAFGGTGFNARFDYVRTFTLPSF